jgi:hypothetical protein
MFIWRNLDPAALASVLTAAARAYQQDRTPAFTESKEEREGLRQAQAETSALLRVVAGAAAEPQPKP